MPTPILGGLRDRLASWLAPASRSLPGPASGAGGLAGVFERSTLAGPPMGEGSALTIAAVYAAVQCYVNTIGSLDFYLAEKDDRGGRRPAYGHPAYDLIRRRPNRLSTSIRFRQALVGHALTLGNGYAQIEWDARERYPVGLHLLDPRQVRPVVSGARVAYEIRSGASAPLRAEDVLHVAGFGFDGVRGYSPVNLGRETLGLAKVQQVYQAGIFGNSANANGHLEIPGNLTSVQAQEWRDNWNRVHQGGPNAGKVGILYGGARWVQTNFSPQDAEIILGCTFSVAEIARLFNLPQHKLGLLEHATFSNIEEQNLDFYMSSIFPWLVAIEQEFDNKLLGPRERERFFVTHSTNDLLRGNMAAQTAQEAADIASGVRSVNEVRSARGLDPIEHPNADKHWIPVNNLMALEDMGTASPPAPAAESDPDTETEQDPTAPASGPPPAATPAPAGAVDAVRSVLADALGRMARAEANAARQAARRDRLDLWAAEFYPRHRERVARDLAPALEACNALTGSTHAPAPLAADLADRSVGQLRNLWTAYPPDEMPAAVEGLAATWEAAAAALAARLVPRPEAAP